MKVIFHFLCNLPTITNKCSSFAQVEKNEQALMFESTQQKMSPVKLNT